MLSWWEWWIRFSGGSREGARGALALPLFLDQPEGLKEIFLRPDLPPPDLSQGLDDRPQPPVSEGLDPPLKFSFRRA